MNPISGTYGTRAVAPPSKACWTPSPTGSEQERTIRGGRRGEDDGARICPDGGRILGPDLKEMKRLAHTEYLIEGRTEMDVGEILRNTMFSSNSHG